jgi:hypothetical protein
MGNGAGINVKMPITTARPSVDIKAVILAVGIG